jgi:NitT/TauT family transport system substrate-binding protein
MRGKRGLLILAILLMAGLAAGLFWFSATDRGLSKGKPNTEGWLGRPLVVGLVSWPGYTGGIVANGGFEPDPTSVFSKKYGIRVKFVLIEDVDARGKAFAQGGPQGLDVVWSTVDFFANEAPNFLKNQIHPVAIMQVDWSQGGDAIVGAQSIHAVEDLKGKKIALVQFTPSHWFLENTLKNSKLSKQEQDQVVRNLVFTQDVPSARQAFVAGKVDAAVVWEPDVSQALKHRAGSHILASTSTNPNLIADVMITKREFAEAYPRTLEAFVRGWFDGVAEAHKDPDRAVQLLMQNELLFKDLGPLETRKALSWVKLTDLNDNTEMFGLDGRPALFDRLFSDAGMLWQTRGSIDEIAQPSLVKDDRFLKAIYAKPQN